MPGRFFDWHHNCVAALINYLRRCRIARQPEQIERDTTEACCPCDASAEQASQPGLAVEHTIIPTFDVQKEKDAQFMRAIGDLVAVDYLCGTVGS